MHRAFLSANASPGIQARDASSSPLPAFTGLRLTARAVRPPAAAASASA
jgi:hypothetical protein